MLYTCVGVGGAILFLFDADVAISVITTMPGRILRISILVSLDACVAADATVAAA